MIKKIDKMWFLSSLFLQLSKYVNSIFIPNMAVCGIKEGGIN